MVTGFIITVCLLTSLVLITCICSGQKSMSELRIIEKQIDSSLYFGKHVKQIIDVMGCAILKTDGLDFLLCPQQNLSTKPQYLVMPDSASFRSLEQMLKRCSQIKLYQYPLTTRFSLNQSKTVWIVQKPSSHIGCLLRSLLEENSSPMRSLENCKD